VNPPLACPALVGENWASGDAEKGLGQTRAYALMPQPETGKISCVHHLPCARLSPGVSRSMLRNTCCSGQCNLSRSVPPYAASVA